MMAIDQFDDKGKAKMEPFGMDVDAPANAGHGAHLPWYSIASAAFFFILGRVEKYRPTALAEVVSHHDIIATRKWINDDDGSHLMISICCW